MKLSIILALILVLVVGIGCIWIKDEDCPYGSMWSEGDRKTVKLPPESERKLVSAVAYRKEEADGNPQQIPRIIIQTNEKRDVPQKMFEATDSVLRFNPSYEYVYFTDDQAKKFLRDHFDQTIIDAYDSIIPGAYKADLFRYCFLWINGGVYIDMGMVALDGLDKIVKSTDTFVAPEDNGANSIYNAFMGCTPKHPIIKEAIVLAVQNIQNKEYTHNPLGITGPLLLGKAFENVTGEKVVPGRDYGKGVRIIKFSKYNRCESGIIHDQGINILATRYPSYRVDQIWYNTKPHYSEMWKKREVFR
jgi:mannosyltransferase OCH1-like enzyme